MNGVEREAAVTENKDGTVNYEIQLDSYQNGEDYVEHSMIIETDEENIEDMIITHDEDGVATGVTIVEEEGTVSTVE